MSESKEERFCKPRLNGQGSSMSTRFLYVAGIGHEMKSDKVAVTRFFESFGELDDSTGDAVDMIPDRRYCYICYRTLAAAESAVAFVSDASNCTAQVLMDAIGASKIVVRYAVEKSSLPTAANIECTSSERNQAVHVNGCDILSNFITESEETQLLEELAGPGAAWKETLSRRVQHFGFPFNYRTLMLDYNKPTPPLPASCAALVQRFADSYNTLHTLTATSTTSSSGDVTTSRVFGAAVDTVESVITPEASAYSGSSSIGGMGVDGVLEAYSINQLTINEYLPGQGIAPHTDTETCLGPVIFILNLGSDIVMALTKPVKTEAEEGKAEASEGAGTPLKKLLHLPARSLLILSGDARYGWQHGIAPRRSDRIDGQLVPRGRRVSLTFRQALKPGALPASELKPGELELDHVVRVYDNIAIHWKHTRGKRKVYWHRVKEFLDALPVGTLMADVGCGDGKYFGVNPGVVTIGCDRSIKLLEVSHVDSADATGRERQHETFCCDAVKVPLTSNTFDATLCIAVLHHLSTVDRRYAVISELLRITKPGGVVMIQAWALEQGSDSKRTFESQDTMVPWRLSKRFLSEAQQQQLLGKGECEEAVGAQDGAAELTAGAPADTPAGSEDRQGMDHEQPHLPPPPRPSTDSGACKHVTEDSGELVFQRYCHVYKEGELEELCSSIPGCVVSESGWDKGNWFVQLRKVQEDRLEALPAGPESKIPVLAPRSHH